MTSVEVLFSGIFWGDLFPLRIKTSPRNNLKSDITIRSVKSGYLILLPENPEFPPPRKTPTGKRLQQPPQIHGNSSTIPFPNRPEKYSNYPPRIYGTLSTTPLKSVGKMH